MSDSSAWIRRIHHVAVVTSNLEAAIVHYVNALKCEPGPIRTIDRPGARFRTAMLPVCQGADTFVQLIEPSEGPGTGELERNGEGALLEIGFEVGDIAEAGRQLQDAGTHLRDVAGENIETEYLTSSFGNRYAFLHPNDMRGTRIELVQVMSTGPESS